MSAGPSQPLGGPAEEARRLVEALGDWATTKLGTVDAQIATGSPECQVCPVCQLIAALRGDRPEVLSRLGDAWTAFLRVLTEHNHSPAQTDAPAGPDPSAQADPPSAQERQDGGGSVRPVQNIDVR